MTAKYRASRAQRRVGSDLIQFISLNGRVTADLRQLFRLAGESMRD